MSKGRLEAFSDGVIAILITIMVLELRAPTGAALSDLAPLTPILLSYALSFVNIAIYWNNHHHLFHAVTKVDGRVLWANLHLLFWLSLFSFATAWMGENEFAPLPVALYGVVLLCAGASYYILERVLLRVPEQNPALGAAVGRDYKGILSLVIYIIAVLFAFVWSWFAFALYIVVAVMWFIPDPRIERKLGA